MGGDWSNWTFDFFIKKTMRKLMRTKRVSDCPVGATWKATSEDGRIGTIWLSKRDGVFELWICSVCFSDGSSRFGDTDWSTSYASCRKIIPIWNYRNGKRLVFKRIK